MRRSGRCILNNNYLTVMVCDTERENLGNSEPLDSQLK